MTRIPVVDDDATLVAMVRAMLEGADLEIEEASNGFEALDAVRTQSPHIVILDLNMPWISGLEVCRLIRRLPEQETPRIVLLTGAAVDCAEAKSAGADQVLSKPVSYDTIRSVVAALTPK